MYTGQDIRTIYELVHYSVSRHAIYSYITLVRTVYMSPKFSLPSLLGKNNTGAYK
jgi:hypothetical protein